MKQEAEKLAKDYYDTSDGTFSQKWELQIKPKLKEYEKFANVTVVKNLEQNIKMFAEGNY